jgi:hypothetical protein
MLSKKIRGKKMIWNDLQIMNEIKELRAELEKKPDKLEKDAYERLADLEVKMAKLWNLLIMQTATGKEKPTKFGRMFGGQARQAL